jgi:hypothetical protein
LVGDYLTSKINDEVVSRKEILSTVDESKWAKWTWCWSHSRYFQCVVHKLRLWLVVDMLWCDVNLYLFVESNNWLLWFKLIPSLYHECQRILEVLQKERF